MHAQWIENEQRAAFLPASLGFMARMAVGAGAFLWLIMAAQLPSFAAAPAPAPPTGSFVQKRLEAHVRQLAGRIGERSIWQREGLLAAESYILSTWRSLGFEVYRQAFISRGVEVANLAVELPGRQLSEEIVVVGAHYDSVRGSPGANDNASGVAALLELTRLLKDAPRARSLRFVAFVNEEPPFFLHQDMGSRVYARYCREQGDDIKAMLSLETVGYYDERPGSQRYPFPFRFFYPDAADFLGFVGNIGSRHLVRRALASFRRASPLPAEGVAAFGWMPGIGWSDHWSFWQAGYRAVMVTDTALYRYDAYHTMADTPEKLDYPRLTLAVEGLSGVIGELISR